jgi:hypothetical protein
LQKTIQFKNQSFEAKVAYTYSQTKDANSGSGSTASSLFQYHPVSGNPNHPRLAFSDNDQPQKLVGYVNYRIEYAHNFASALSIVYQGYVNDRFSYTYGGSNGDYNNDGSYLNDLIYIPRNASEINLVAYTPAGASGPYTAAQQWTDLNNYINQDSYLNKHRGQIAERNGEAYPWRSEFDLKFVQDVFMNIGGKRNTLEFCADIVNFGNLLNHNWGLAKSVNNSTPINYQGVVNGQPTFEFPVSSVNSAGTIIPLTSTFSNAFSTSSLWQMQLGIRYIFN